MAQQNGTEYSNEEHKQANLDLYTISKRLTKAEANILILQDRVQTIHEKQADNFIEISEWLSRIEAKYEAEEVAKMGSRCLSETGSRTITANPTAWQEPTMGRTTTGLVRRKAGGGEGAQ